MSAGDLIDCISKFEVPLVVDARIVAAPLQVLHLVDVHAEQEEVLGAHLFAHFDVGAVKSADGECPVQLELHVAGARRFGASRRQLLAQIRRRDDLLRERNAVVFKVDAPSVE